MKPVVADMELEAVVEIVVEAGRIAEARQEGERVSESWESTLEEVGLARRDEVVVQEVGSAVYCKNLVRKEKSLLRPFLFQMQLAS
jgi:hypothetical protein